MKNNSKITFTPRREAFLPILLATVCMFIAFLSLIIDRFIFHFGNELLSPAITQIITLLIPAYLYLLFTGANKPFCQHMSEIGMGRIKADSVFLIIFASMFVISTSLLLNIVFGGSYFANVFSLPGGFVAGENEYTVSYIYLIAVYALIPALCEEFVFRGVIYSELSKINKPFAAVLSSLISAFFVFNPGGLPAAILCGVTYCFILYTTNSLQACMIIHFVCNLFGLFMGTNIYKYFISAKSNALLIIILVMAWLISCSLFFAEGSKIYRKKAADIKNGLSTEKFPHVKPKTLVCDIGNAIAFKPTLTTSIVFAFFYIATVIIQYFIR
jgi:membrane protease YdiL (CAAX protease family)